MTGATTSWSLSGPDLLHFSVSPVVAKALHITHTHTHTHTHTRTHTAPLLARHPHPFHSISSSLSLLNSEPQLTASLGSPTVSKWPLAALTTIKILSVIVSLARVSLAGLER